MQFPVISATKTTLVAAALEATTITMQTDKQFNGSRLPNPPMSLLHHHHHPRPNRHMFDILAHRPERVCRTKKNIILHYHILVMLNTYLLPAIQPNDTASYWQCHFIVSLHSGKMLENEENFQGKTTLMWEKFIKFIRHIFETYKISQIVALQLF